MSRQRKRDAVLRLLRGEDLNMVSRSLGMTAATESGWRDAFLDGGEASLATKPRSGEARESDRLKVRLGEMPLERKLLAQKIAPLEGGGQHRPFGLPEVEAMSRILSPSNGKPYGLACVWRARRSARARIYRHRHPALARQRSGPAGPMPDAVLPGRIRSVLSDSPFHDEGHRKVWARLRIGGIRTSLRRVLRLMRENDLLASGRVGQPRGPRDHNGIIIPNAIDVIWGTNMTTTWTAEGQVAVFVAVDHHNAECIGVHAARRGTPFEALEPPHQGVRRHFGAIGKDVVRGLAVRHDHGLQYMSDIFQTEMGFLGIPSSPVFLQAPEGNGCAKRLIRTLKENLLWIRTLATVEELRLALLAFRDVYSTTRLIQRLNYRPPPKSDSSSFQPLQSPVRFYTDVSSSAGGTLPTFGRPLPGKATLHPKEAFPTAHWSLDITEHPLRAVPPIGRTGKLTVAAARVCWSLTTPPGWDLIAGMV